MGTCILAALTEAAVAAFMPVGTMLSVLTIRAELIAVMIYLASHRRNALNFPPDSTIL